MKEKEREKESDIYLYACTAQSPELLQGWSYLIDDFSEKETEREKKGYRVSKKEKRAIQSKKKRKERDIPVCLHCAISRTAPGLELARRWYQRERNRERKRGIQRKKGKESDI